jgi:hypothetical protein
MSVSKCHANVRSSCKLHTLMTFDNDDEAYEGLQATEIPRYSKKPILHREMSTGHQLTRIVIVIVPFNKMYKAEG